MYISSNKVLKMGVFHEIEKINNRLKYNYFHFYHFQSHNAMKVEGTAYILVKARLLYTLTTFHN